MATEDTIKYVMYLRKSTDSEDYQIQSIEDQRKELNKLVERRGLAVVNVFQESKTAKKPGRIEFNRMLDFIDSGKANGILCWKANRLARNPSDGGKIQWFLQEGIIQSILTPHGEYVSDDNSLILAVELGIATQFSRDLSKDVKRGSTTKAEKGWRPGRAPIGYRNDKFEEKGKKKVFVDEDKFPLVRKLWDLMLTGNYSVSQVADIANNKLGLRSIYKKKENKIHISHMYRILTNHFYYGEFSYAGKDYQGEHKPMITPEEYDRVQKILGKKGKQRPKTKKLPFTGIIKCGHCGCSITAEEKTKFVKSKNSMHSYVYHRCTKKKPEIKCNQKPISLDKLKGEIEKALDRITIPQGILDLAIEVLNEKNDVEAGNRNTLIKNQQKALDSCLSRIDNLIKLYISPENINKELISDEEFKNQKATLVGEKTTIQIELKKLDERVDEWMELTEKTFNFAVYAKSWFENGNYETKTSILRALGSDFVLKDQNLYISLAEPLNIIEQGLEKIKLENPTLELNNFTLDKAKTGVFAPVFDTMSG